jgi:hypothetical protein
MVLSGVGISRRGVLGVGAALVVGASSRPVGAAAVAGRDFTTRATFDALDRGYYGGNGRKGELNELRGALAWDEAYVLQAYVLMLEAHRDTYYADKLVDHIDHVLATRDSVRGVSAFPGRSMPVWRCTTPYNVGEAVLLGDDGRPVLRLRCAGGSAETVTVAVARPTPDGFDLDARRMVSSAQAGPSDLTAVLPPDRGQVLAASSSASTQTYLGLHLDPDRDGYAVRQVNDAFTASSLRLTAQIVPGVPRDGLPRAGSYRFSCLPYVHPVHTGMIVWPMARFARLALRNRYLARYRSKATGYLAAAQAALQSHDDELRHDPLTQRSWYAAGYGCPYLLDGSDHPLNYTAAMARAWREVALTSGDRARVKLARALTRTFTQDAQPTIAGGLVWGYYRRDGTAYAGWSPQDGVSQNWPAYAGGRFVEDLSHGHLEVDLIARARQLADLEDAATLDQLATTFTGQLIGRTADGRPLVHARVDGTGTATTAQSCMVAGWLGVASQDPSIVTVVRDVFADLDPTPSALSLYGCAYLNWRTRNPQA